MENGLLPLVRVKGETGWNILERMRHYKVPGVGVAVIHHHEVVWAKGYGLKDGETEEPVTDTTLFIAGSISKPVAAMGALRLVQEGKLSLDENINTEFEDGTPVMSDDYSTMYFTRCKVNKNTNFGCQIYTSNRVGEGWSPAEPLTISDDSVVIAHPAISSDELTLYFVSDMPGGEGGKDIWMVERENSGAEFGPPVNLEAINTVDDEMFPLVIFFGISQSR